MFRTRGRKQITMDHVMNGTFTPEYKRLHWVPQGKPTSEGSDVQFSSFGPAGDGVFSEEQDGNIILIDLRTGVNRTLVFGKDVVDVNSCIVVTCCPRPEWHYNRNTAIVSHGTAGSHHPTWITSCSRRTF